MRCWDDRSTVSKGGVRKPSSDVLASRVKCGSANEERGKLRMLSADVTVQMWARDTCRILAGAENTNYSCCQQFIGYEMYCASYYLLPSSNVLCSVLIKFSALRELFTTPCYGYAITTIT